MMKDCESHGPEPLTSSHLIYNTGPIRPRLPPQRPPAGYSRPRWSALPPCAPVSTHHRWSKGVVTSIIVSCQVSMWAPLPLFCKVPLHWRCLHSAADITVTTVTTVTGCATNRVSLSLGLSGTSAPGCPTPGDEAPGASMVRDREARPPRA